MLTKTMTFLAGWLMKQDFKPALLEQKCIYESQIELKSERNELPKGIPIHVIPDPDGPKIGNGGSTLNAISSLYSIYGNEMFQFRILMIHAGGLSKRIPSTSVLGKIFSPIPKGSPMFQMLDLKLAMYLPLIPRMPPGILVCCADDILVYNLGSDDNEWELSDSGFTVFAHPSVLEFGVKHGVYVIDNKDVTDTETLVKEGDCLEVLQKPSVETMFEKGAVLDGEDLIFPDGITIHGRTVYTDSCFFFAMDTTDLYNAEIDAYGDFLPALGPRATVDYIHNTSNVTTVLPNLLPTRKKVFDLLRGTKIKLYMMNSSRYIHIGTTKEYINHFCLDSDFSRRIRFDEKYI
ncbi:hypothetical protein KUTeg_011707 [Tegillarca granosa]|uniref:GDP-fucose pyrophosphorylase domain-containing protein n=1 Tax=Tegillarca granosa TaxID=220873 RepID=A0ABQ9F0Q5_TEGGR|nr:hypothetical protein KUTeg_011707 [Tegillarca granosa]